MPKGCASHSLPPSQPANTEAALWPIDDLSSCLKDRYEQSGAASGHYFHQDLLVARRVHARAQEAHVDMGSRIDGFVAHVAGDIAGAFCKGNSEMIASDSPRR